MMVQSMQFQGIPGWPGATDAASFHRIACPGELDGAPMLRISLLDGIALYVGNREVALNQRKARALIAYLALARGMRETRSRLVGLLWSETEDAKARASLRQLLHLLREIFDRGGIVGLSADKDLVSLDRSAVITDVDWALASIDRADPVAPLLNEFRITDTFLRGYEDVDPAFCTWLRTKRENIRQQLIRRLETQLSNPSHQAQATERIARALFQVDPTHEIACQYLMRACVASGNAGGALATYKQLWERLEQEYDIEPSKATQQLVVTIRNAAVDPHGLDGILRAPTLP